jgi:hypothetical protein
MFSLSGAFPGHGQQRESPSHRERVLSPTLDDLVIADKTIKRFIENHKGTIKAPAVEKDRITFSFVIST